MKQPPDDRTASDQQIRETTMPDPHQIKTRNPRATRDVAVHERDELLDHVQAIVEPAMALLGLVFLVLLLLDYTTSGLSTQTQARIDVALQVIWIIFLVDFAIRLVIAPAKGHFLRRNWLSVLSLGLPFLRPLRLFRAARALRSLSLVRFLGGINRGIRVLRTVTRGRQFAYVGALTVLVILAGAVGGLYFDRDVEDAPIQSFGDAVWWSSTMVTTINSDQYVVSTEARVIAILIRLFAVSVFGFVTASIATYLIGTAAMTDTQAPEEADLRSEIATLRHELALVRQTLAASDDAPSQERRDDPNTQDLPD